MPIAVAIVEDHAGTRASLRQWLQRAAGFRCVCACADGEEALRVIPQLRPEVVLMELHLPGISGIECMARLKQFAPRVQILVLTVLADPESIFKALKAGASGYLLKPATPAQIRDAIAEVQRGGAPMSSAIARLVVQSFQVAGKSCSQFEPLTRREEEILECLARGCTSKEIAAALSISFETVRTHLHHVYEKLHVRSRTEAVIKYLH